MIITELHGYDPIPDGIDHDHLAKVRKARLEKGLPVEIGIHPFLRVPEKPDYSKVIFGDSDSRDQEGI